MDWRHAPPRTTRTPVLRTCASQEAAVALPATAFFAASWLVLGVTGSSRMFQDPGVFWHLLTGERVLSVGLPREDWLTFTYAGKPWIAHQWLAEVGMAFLHRIGGYDVLLVFASGLVALLFTWLLQRLVNRGVQPRWAILLCALALLTSAGSIHVRPLLLSMAFFALVCFRLIEVETGRHGVGRLAWLLPVFVVWSNCHGAALGGIASVGLAGALWLGAWRTGRTSPIRDGAGAATAALIVVGSALAPLANPYGLDLIRTWLAILRSPAIAELIVEHGSVWRTGSWYVLPLALAYLAVWAGAGRDRWRASSVLALVWLVLMAERVRHAPLFAIVASLSLAELLPRSATVAWLARRGVQLWGRPSAVASLPRGTLLAPVLVLAIAGLHFQLTGASLGGPRGGPWPFELTPAIESAVRPLGPGAPILNDMVLGGFISHEIRKARIFGDDRCELYGDDFLRGWITGGTEWFATWVARYDVRVAVAQRGTALDAYLRAAPGWREASGTGAFALFLRPTAAPEASRRP